MRTYQPYLETGDPENKPINPNLFLANRDNEGLECTAASSSVTQDAVRHEAQARSAGTPGQPSGAAGSLPPARACSSGCCLAWNARAGCDQVMARFPGSSRRRTDSWLECAAAGAFCSLLHKQERTAAPSRGKWGPRTPPGLRS